MNRNHTIAKRLLLIVLCILLIAVSACAKTANTPNENDGRTDSTDQGDKDKTGTPGDGENPDGEETADERQEGASSLPELTEPLSGSNFLLNTIVTIQLYDRGTEETIQACFDLCRDYEAKLSRTIETSEISRLNHADAFPVTVSSDTADLLNKALEYSVLSEGAFDLTIAPLTSIWDFTSAAPVKPSDDAITEALRHIGYQDVRIDGCDVTFTDPNTAIDLGAIAKGYIADRIKDYLLSQGVQSAVINLGGNVLCVGGKPDGSGFRIGIQKPFENRNETIAIVEINDRSVVSSGIYERFFKEDGVLYHHILNPATGYPYESDLTAVTILSKESVDGDGLSTTCFALGLEKGLALIHSLPDVDAVFITDDYELHYSDGFAEHVKIIED